MHLQIPPRLARQQSQVPEIKLWKNLGEHYSVCCRVRGETDMSVSSRRLSHPDSKGGRFKMKSKPLDFTKRCLCKRSKDPGHQSAGIEMLIAALFAMGWSWKQSKCQPTGEWISKLQLVDGRNQFQMLAGWECLVKWKKSHKEKLIIHGFLCVKC